MNTVDEDLSKLQVLFEDLRSEALVIGLLRDSPVLIAFRDETHFKALAGGWAKMLGWTNEELLRRPWRAFVHPDEKLTDCENVVQTNRFARADGQWALIRWLTGRSRNDMSYTVAVVQEIAHG